MTVSCKKQRVNYVTLTDTIKNSLLFVLPKKFYRKKTRKVNGTQCHSLALYFHFILLAEQTNDPDILYELLDKVAYTFTEKVAQAQTPASTDERLQIAIQYIQPNTHLHIIRQ